MGVNRWRDSVLWFVLLWGFPLLAMAQDHAYRWNTIVKELQAYSEYPSFQGLTRDIHSDGAPTQDEEGARAPRRWAVLLGGGWVKPLDFPGLYGFQVSLRRDLGHRLQFQGGFGVALGSNDETYDYMQAGFPSKQVARTTIRQWSLTGSVQRDVLHAGGWRFWIGAGLGFHRFDLDVEIDGVIAEAIYYSGSGSQAKNRFSPHAVVLGERDLGRRGTLWVSVLYDVVGSLGEFRFPVDFSTKSGSGASGTGRYPSLQMSGWKVYAGLGIRL